MALPELDGGLEPIVFAGRDSATGKSHSLPDRIASLTSRAIKWAQVRDATLLPLPLWLIRADGRRGVPSLHWLASVVQMSAACTLDHPHVGMLRTLAL